MTKVKAANRTPHAARPTLTLVAAMSENRVIGRDGDLPWHLPDELKHFKQVTSGGLVLMGRATFESFDGLLPNRRHIILTRDPNWTWPGPGPGAGVQVAGSLDEALAIAREHGDDELLILGGAKVYAQTIDHATKMILTLVHATLEGDAFFPEFDPRRWTVTDEQHHPADAKHEYAFTVRTLIADTFSAV